MEGGVTSAAMAQGGPRRRGAGGDRLDRTRTPPVHGRVAGEPPALRAAHRDRAMRRGHSCTMRSFRSVCRLGRASTAGLETIVSFSFCQPVRTVRWSFVSRDPSIRSHGALHRARTQEARTQDKKFGGGGKRPCNAVKGPVRMPPNRPLNCDWHHQSGRQDSNSATPRPPTGALSICPIPWCASHVPWRSRRSALPHPRPDGVAGLPTPKRSAYHRSSRHAGHGRSLPVTCRDSHPMITCDTALVVPPPLGDTSHGAELNDPSDSATTAVTTTAVTARRWRRPPRARDRLPGLVPR